MTPEQIRIWDYLFVNTQGMINAKHIGDIAFSNKRTVIWNQ